MGEETLATLASFPLDWPELELLPLASAGVATNDSGNYMSLNVALLTTTSRGNVTINSTDANDNPSTSPNWLLTSMDQDLSVQALKRVREIVASSGISIGPEISPGPSVQSDDEILEYIKQSIGPIHHACATCAMGKADDPNAVVDTVGRVYGVKRLRVIDASIFPFLPPGHCQSTVCK